MYVLFNDNLDLFLLPQLNSLKDDLAGVFSRISVVTSQPLAPSFEEILRNYFQANVTTVHNETVLDEDSIARGKYNFSKFREYCREGEEKSHEILHTKDCLSSVKKVKFNGENATMQTETNDFVISPLIRYS